MHLGICKLLCSFGQEKGYFHSSLKRTNNCNHAYIPPKHSHIHTHIHTCVNMCVHVHCTSSCTPCVCAMCINTVGTLNMYTFQWQTDRKKKETGLTLLNYWCVDLEQTESKRQDNRRNKVHYWSAKTQWKRYQHAHKNPGTAKCSVQLLSWVPRGKRGSTPGNPTTKMYSV